MHDEGFLQRLAENVTPGDGLRARVSDRIQARIQPRALANLVPGVTPAKDVRLSLRQRILGAIKPSSADELASLAADIGLPATSMNRLKNAVLSRLEPLQESVAIHSGLKWTAAFAVFILIIRAMPLILLAPSIQAEVGVQLIPGGEDVSVYVGGVWRPSASPEILRGPVMVRTGIAPATLILSDQGVLRLAPNTVIKLHDSEAAESVLSPTATIVRGQLWALGLLPPIVDGLRLETSHGTLSLNAGSTSVSDDGDSVSVSVFDKGVTFQHGKQTAFLVTGEKIVVKDDRPFSIISLPANIFAEPWVKDNLSQDAVHRNEIAKLQEERREKMAGILPTSIFYSAKRMAEEVDVFFTLTHDGRTEKRISQANTRLNEALALIKDGQNNEATGPLTEYKQSLVALASDDGDNLVKYLIKKQIADASTTLSTPLEGTGSVALLQEAVMQVGAAIPNGNLSARDIEGYILVDKLAQIHESLLAKQNSASAAETYAEVQPYLSALLQTQSGAHPLLQKEARALLVSASALIKNTVKTGSDAVLIAMQTDIEQYLPQEQADVLLSEEELTARVQSMMERIFVFRHPRSRYNQLLAEMQNLRGDPNRGTLLRRLKHALPEGLGEYVNTEIQQLGDELSGR